MGGLFSSLNTASVALQTFSRALGTDQTNIANSSTPGYAAIRANITPIDVSGDGSPGGDFVSLSSSGDSRTDALVQAATSQSSYSQTSASQLSPVNQQFDITGSSGILAALQNFSAAFSNLSVTPNDSTLGSLAISAANGVASAFRSVAANLDTQRGQVDASIQSTTQQINGLAQKIGQLNVLAAGQEQVNPGVDASLRSDLDQLSSLVDVTVLRNSNGTVNVLAGGQLPLVEGGQAFTLTANPSNGAGAQITSSGGGGSPQTFSGQLGALLQTRNGTLNQLLGSGGSAGTLNTLASGFASRVNTLLTSGVTAGGAAGVPLFIFDGSDPTNAARTLAIDPSVSAGQLGLATTGASAQSNGIANQLAALSTSGNAADQISGQSAAALFGSIAASIGQQLSDAQSASSADQTTLTSAQSNRQQASGVSLDQEALNITQYQRSYEASARLVGILDELTNTEVNLIK